MIYTKGVDKFTVAYIIYVMFKTINTCYTCKSVHVYTGYMCYIKIIAIFHKINLFALKTG